MNDCCEMTAEREPTAKERVQFELDEIRERIAKLSRFLFSNEILEAKSISVGMRHLMRRQLCVMQDYAEILQERLTIWDKPDEDFNPKHI
nr:MAG TPA: hypothetical protein [Caudoviricetes sp.]